MHCHVDCLLCGPTTHYYRSLRRRYVCAYLLDPPPVLSCACADVVLASVLSSVDCSITVVVVLWPSRTSPRSQTPLSSVLFALACFSNFTTYTVHPTHWPRNFDLFSWFFSQLCVEKHSCYSVLGGRNIPSSSWLGCLHLD